MQTSERAYKFEELSDAAKSSAMDNYAVHDGYHEFVYDQYIKQGVERGFNIENISYSGFWSQGDGASWVGYVWMKDFIAYHIKEDHPLYALSVVLIDLMEEGWVERTARVHTRNNNHYSHSHTMNVDGVCMTWGLDPECVMERGPLAGANVCALVEMMEEETNFINDLCELVQDKARAYADEIYKALEEEYNSYFDPDNFKELADANDWLFDESGQLI